MKKRFGIFGVIALLGIGCGIALAQPTKEVAQSKVENPYVLRLEEESGEVVEETKEEPIVEVEDTEQEQEEDKDIVETVKSEIEQIKDTIVTVLNQPIVIGGASVTLGALILWVLGKLIGALKTKKIKELISQVKSYATLMSNSVSKEDYNKLVKSYNELLPVLKELGSQVKNVNVRENVNALLLECKPIMEDTKEFAKEEHDKVVADTKAFIKEEVGKTSILDILNKD